MLKDYEYLDFDIVEEGWNEYKIQDGTQLHIKFVMIKILRKKISGGWDFKFNSYNVTGIHSSTIREPAKNKYLPKELSDSIIELDMEYKTIGEVWNKYLIKKDKSQIWVKIAITNIQKADKYDEYGDPIYNIKAQPIFKGVPPKKL